MWWIRYRKMIGSIRAVRDQVEEEEGEEVVEEDVVVDGVEVGEEDGEQAEGKKIQVNVQQIRCNYCTVLCTTAH